MRLWSSIVRISLGGFFELYDVALTAVASPGLVKAGIFRESATGLFGYPDQATFAFVTLFGIYLGSLAAGAFSDRLGRKPVFTYAMLWYAAATLIMGCQSTPMAICTWRLIASCGIGAEMVTIDCYLIELVPPELRGRAFSLAQFLQLLGVPAAHLLGYALARHDPFGIAGWRWLTFTPCAGALLVWLLRRGIPESPKWLAERNRPRRAMSGAPVSLLWRAPLRRRVLFLAVANAASSLAFYGFANWLPSLLSAQGVAIQYVFKYTAAIGLTYPLTPILCTLFADRIERKWQIVASAILAAVLGLLLARQAAGSLWVIFGVLLAASNQVRVTAEHIYRGELFPTAIRARAVGIVYSSTRLVAALSSYLVGFVLVRAGAFFVFALLAGALTVCAGVTALFGPKTRHVEENAS
jgi:putative MFS transporter